jgi:hypothetical protein
MLFLELHKDQGVQRAPKTKKARPSRTPEGAEGALRRKGSDPDIVSLRSRGMMTLSASVLAARSSGLPTDPLEVDRDLWAEGPRVSSQRRHPRALGTRRLVWPRTCKIGCACIRARKARWVGVSEAQPHPASISPRETPLVLPGCAESRACLLDGSVGHGGI